MRPNVPRDYLYRTDSNKNLCSIAEKGLLCVGPTSVQWQAQGDLPYETELASLAGLAVPAEDLVREPRLYFFLDEESARGWNQGFSFPPYNLSSVLRFSRRAPRLTDESLFFYDGSFSSGSTAAYVVCPGTQVGAVGVEPEYIEVLTRKGWKPVVEYAERLRARAEAKAARRASHRTPPPSTARTDDGGWLTRLIRYLYS